MIIFICEIFIPFEKVYPRKNPKKEYERIQKEIKEKQKALRKAKLREKSILKEIETLNKHLHDLKVKIKKQKQKVYKLERKSYKLKKKIKEITAKIQKQQKWLKRKIVAMQKYGYTTEGYFISSNNIERVNPFILLITSEDITDFIRRWYYLKKIAEYEYNLLNNYENNLKTLSKEKENFMQLLKILKKEQYNLLKQESELRKKKRRKREILASVKKEKYLYKKMLSELKKSSKKLRKLIIESEKKKFAHKGFSKMKRKLQWPVNGKLALPYGSYIDPKFKTPVFRNGIHIRAREGATVKAVYGGKVVFADWLRGYGKVVIINHGEGYYTVYANLSEIFLSKGDIIKRGEPVGRVGESGTMGMPGLYFEVRYKGKALNPLHWLKRKKS